MRVAERLHEGCALAAWLPCQVTFLPSRRGLTRMVSIRQRCIELIPELAKFGVVGLIGSVIDLGGAAYLHGALGVGPMVAKGLAILAATVVTYFGSRFWTFRHRV